MCERHIYKVKIIMISSFHNLQYNESTDHKDTKPEWMSNGKVVSI